jgi:DNA mismatch repair protein MutS
VIQRAQEILAEFESGSQRQAAVTAETPALQMALFRQDSALAQELSELDIDSMTPLQAITRLYELAERARQQLA